ncbi:TPM domain-containing protein [Agromyces atrinae]|uniref:Heme exporter protein D n=1 Tax=Agromyces atrinae TaxID=592376 RepID=A0A4Q2M564_9MICO|nr:TPM domain-containing protein [Agromyces atrinae]NYD66584.1 heme exporter protein D [Agromyces atrinae]RXZ87254.1 TPM domain-containing protein [Agromyces atrinae]
MRVRRAILGLAAALLLVGVSTPAWAQSPVEFTDSPIIDTVGALDGDSRPAEAMAELVDDTGRQLFVAFVDTFDSPTSAQEWADTTAVANGMGDEDYLLAVAVDSRNYYFSVAGTSSVSDSDIQRINRDFIEPALRDSDWAGAVLGAVDGLGGPSSTGPDFGWVWVLVALAVIALVVIIVIAVSRRRRRASAEASLAELRREAGSALVQADDAIRTSEEELGFALASYGEESVRPFREALTTARARIGEAFALQQKLDDAEPDTDEQRRAWYAQIIELADRADDALDAQTAAFDALRALEQNAPAEIERVHAAVEVARARRPEAAAALTTLAATYAQSALDDLLDAPAEIDADLEVADTAIERARTEVAAGNTGGAAVGIRLAEEAVTRAAAEADGVAALSQRLAEADAAVDAGIADLENDLVISAGLPADPELAAVVGETQRAIAELRAGRAATPRDPLALASTLGVANARIDAVIRRISDAQAAAERSRAMLGRSLSNAQARIAAAEEFIVARRNSVGVEARTRLASAGALLVEARGMADPTAANDAALRAATLGDEALRLAHADLTSDDGLSGLFPGAGGTTGSDFSSDIIGGILGGLIGGSVGRSSRGGSSWGSSWGGSSRRSSGSFGRSSGGRSRSSSGGRRGGGGRF